MPQPIEMDGFSDSRSSTTVLGYAEARVLGYTTTSCLAQQCVAASLGLYAEFVDGMRPVDLRRLLLALKSEAQSTLLKC